MFSINIIRNMLLCSKIFLRIALLCSLLSGCSQEKVVIEPYPPGFDFAFTITDDPDDGWLEQKRIVYNFLDSIGMKTSMGVWVFNNKRGSGNLVYYNQGVSLENPEFADYAKKMKSRGFELFLHTVTGGNDLRQETIAGFEAYFRIFGEYPHHWINHFTNYDNIYWGYKRFNNSLIRKLYRWYLPIEFQGDYPDSPYFWGDLCKKHITYVRGWATSDINTLKFNPNMPYHDPNKPYVKYWYACSDGAERVKFNKLINKKNIDRLIREKGTAIIYTHFAKGFVDREGNLNEETKQLLSYVSSHKNGWFVPVNIIMERLESLKSIKVYEENDRYVIVNTGVKSSENLAVRVNSTDGVIYDNKMYRPSSGNPSSLVIKQIPAGYSVTLMKMQPKKKPYLSRYEQLHLGTSWLISRFY
jgi:hypothetical protein